MQKGMDEYRKGIGDGQGRENTWKFTEYMEVLWVILEMEKLSTKMEIIRVENDVFWG